MKQTIVLETPNFRLRERESVSGELSFDLQMRRRSPLSTEEVANWRKVHYEETGTVWAFCRELGFALRGIQEDK